MLWSYENTFCEYASKTDTEEKKLLNEIYIFVFFAHKWFL